MLESGRAVKLDASEKTPVRRDVLLAVRRRMRERERAARTGEPADERRGRRGGDGAA